MPQPRLACAYDGLRPVGHLQLEEDVSDVVAYRLYAEKELPSYLFVAVDSGDEGEGLFFAVGELRDGSGVAVLALLRRRFS